MPTFPIHSVCSPHLAVLCWRFRLHLREEPPPHSWHLLRQHRVLRPPGSLSEFSLALLFLCCLLPSSSGKQLLHSRMEGRPTHPVEFPRWVPLGLWHCRGFFSHQCRILGIAGLHNHLNVKCTIYKLITWLITCLIKISNWILHVINSKAVIMT